MFYAVRQQLDESEPTPAASDAQSETQNGEKYTARKMFVGDFWGEKLFTDTE